MRLHTAIFDMDGLLIDSEPLWQMAAIEYMKKWGVDMDANAYASTVGLRTKEFLQYWFQHYGIDTAHAEEAEDQITRLVIEKVKAEGVLMPGADKALKRMSDAGLRIGLATSSPLSLVDAFFEKTGLTSFFAQVASAEHLAFGKPHPEVYINCARELGSKPENCVCLEDSFNGMLAAKAARMKCIVVPSRETFDQGHWQAADKKISSLDELTIDMIEKL